MSWDRGPFPQGLIARGAIVTAESYTAGGYHHAEFKGDYAILDDGRRIACDEAVLYNPTFSPPMMSAARIAASMWSGDGVYFNTPVPPGCSTGLILRNYITCPQGYQSFAPAYPDDELIPESEWPARLASLRETKSGLLDLREAYYEILRSLDQDGLGLCWAFSSTKAVMYVRAIMNAAFLRLSAWYVAGIINRWRDEGGWGSASLEFIVNTGVPAESYCPSYRSSYDTTDTRANAALHKVTEWWDGSESTSLATKQLVSSLLKRRPCVVDLNDMGHSMCAIDIGSLSPLEIIYDNSWGDGGEKGLYRGRGARARPDGLVIPRVSLPTPV